MDESYVYVKESPLVRWARRRFAISAYGPFAVDVAIAVGLGLYGRIGGEYVVLVILLVLGLGAFELFIDWNCRNDAAAWQASAGVTGVAAAGMLWMPAGASYEHQQFGLDKSTYYIILGVCSLGIFLLSLLPVRRAAHLIMKLPSDVIESSLEITLVGRWSGLDRNLNGEHYYLTVHADRIEFYIRRPGRRMLDTKREFPLLDIDGISVRTEPEDTEYRVPGLKTTKIRVRKGDVVVFSFVAREPRFINPNKELAEGDRELVFPTDEPERVKRFVEARVRRAAAAAG